MNINFYNNYHNGDIHFSRGLIKLIKLNFINSKYNFLHKNKKGLLKDLLFINEIDLNEYCVSNDGVKIINNNIYINTWYGQNNFKFYNLGGGSTFETVKFIAEDVLKKLNLNNEFDEEILYPSIDFDKIILPKIEDKFSILICNGNSLSGQSNNINLNILIDTISRLYPDINFYVTTKTDIIKKNIIYTSDITNCSPDLLEISYISKKCSIIIGRGSGPYSFSIILDNIKDKNKTFLGICNNYLEGIWNEKKINCKYFHNPSSDINLIIENLINIIKSYEK